MNSVDQPLDIQFTVVPAHLGNGVIQYKFDEGRHIKEFEDYINSTYSGHYSTNKFQATEFIIDGGHGTGFCIGNVLKYAQRYGKKGTKGDARKDLMKVLHYALIQLYIHDNELGQLKEDNTEQPSGSAKRRTK